MFEISQAILVEFALLPTLGVLRATSVPAGLQGRLLLAMGVITRPRHRLRPLATATLMQSHALVYVAPLCVRGFVQPWPDRVAPLQVVPSKWCTESTTAEHACSADRSNLDHGYWSRSMRALGGRHWPANASGARLLHRRAGVPHANVATTEIVSGVADGTFT